MGYKQYTLEGDTTITVFKHKKSRKLRLTVRSDGNVRVSIPTWTSFAKGYAFALEQKQWILAKRQPIQALMQGGQIGKAHHLRFVPDSSIQKPISKLTLSEIIVRYPLAMSVTDPGVQQSAQRACVRALRKQAEQLLPQRLAELASKTQLSYASVTVKQLKGRWGSCDQRKNIVLNLFLMQLPWNYIDYVIKHELTHTQYMNHSADFWEFLESIEPHAKSFRLNIKQYRPIVLST